MTPELLLATTAMLVGSAVVLLAWRRPDDIIDHPRLVLGTLAVVSAAAVAALLGPDGVRIRLDPSEEPLLLASDPARLVYEEAIMNFGDDDLFVVAMQTQDAFTAAHLGALKRAGGRIRRLPGVRSIDSLTDTTTYRYRAEEDLVEVDRFIEDVPTEPAALAELRRRALDDPIYPRTIVSRDGTTAALNVAFRTMSDGTFVERQLDRRIRKILDDESTAERRFFVTGRQHIKAQAYHQMLSDLVRLLPLAVVVGTTIAWLISGRVRGAVIPVGGSLLATLWAFGALASLGRPLNLITIVLGPTLICVGSVYGVHVLARFEEMAAAAGDSRAGARACLRYTLAPVLIAGLTTIAGFGALLLADTPAIQELGALAALGVGSISVIALSGIPALLGSLRLPEETDRSRHRVSRMIGASIERGLATLARTTTHRPRTTLALWLLALVLALGLLPRIVVDTDYLTFFHRESRVRRDFASVSRLLVGAVPIYVTLDGGVEGAFREPENLRALARLQERVEALDGVSATLSAVDLIKLLNRAVERDDPAAFRIPDTRAEVAELMFLIPKNTLRRYANANHSRVNLLVRTGESGSEAILTLERRLRDAIAASALPADVHAEVTGNAIVFNRGSDAVVRNQLSTVGAATVTIFLLVSWAFSSWRIGLLAMIPNVVPVAMYFGALGLGAAPLSLPTSLIGCIALGIAVDDTAHFLVAYRHRRQRGMTVRAAAEECIRVLGHPIIATSLMLSGGFLVMWLSEFATLGEFGYLSAITMLICLCADLILLPAILVTADR